MESDKEYLDKVGDVVAAAQSFLDIDAAYGSNDSRTGVKKDRLAQAMQALTPSNVDVYSIVPGADPEIDKGNPAFRPPLPDPQRWSPVRGYLTQGCELPARWIDALHDRGMIYADLRGNAVFIGENELREPSVAHVHGIGSPSPAPEPSAQPGWFTVRLPAEEPGHRPVLILAGDPVDALSALEVHRRINHDRPDGKGERGPAAAIAIEGSGAMPHWAIRETLSYGGTVRVAVGNIPTAERLWEDLRSQYPLDRLERQKPWARDWNDVLRFHNACRHNPEAANEQLRELQRQNAPDEHSRAAVHEAVRKWAPAKLTVRDWER